MNRHKAGGVTQKNFKVAHFPSEGNALSYIERAIQKGHPSSFAKKGRGQDR